MKAQINNENKAKFFALYWGQQVIKSNNCSGLNYYDEDWISYYNLLTGDYLLLKPLSAISDEDAIEVARILSNGMSKDWSLNRNDGICGFYSSKYGNVFLYEDLSFGGNLFEADYHKLPVAVDYLRSKGYALPFLGLSVEEMCENGWIKLTNHK